MVFKTNVSTGKAMVRYWILAAGQMAAQFLLDEGAYVLFGIAGNATGMRVLVHTVVMVCLYFASFMIQQRWVFAADETPKEKV
jgi:hypothetical protein